ncbi:MAG: ComEC/Rec2 family competence protein [Opitutae bacterium]|nr:ComEC/Rec2 family competence protein [Opitutae bacterium]MCD8299437.1 ComEC/Rec2 family competence protein [Opitutae bacterium]
MKSEEPFLENDTVESAATKGSGFRVPLLWILFPQVCAYALSEAGFSLSRSAIPVALCCALVLAVVGFVAALKNFRKGSWLCTTIWKCALPPAVLFLAGAWWSFRAPPEVDWRSVPESDVIAEIEIESPFRSAGKSWTGLARVEKISGAGVLPQGARAYYQFSKKEFGDAPVEGMKLRLKADAGSVAKSKWLASRDTGFRDFLLSRRADIYVSRCREIEVVESGIFVKFAGWCAQRKREIVAHFIVAGDKWERESRVICAMMLGENALLFPEQKSDFSATGVAHVFAISGLHVGIVSMALFLVLRKILSSYTVSVAITLAVIFFCIQIAGASPSALRAFVMIAFLFFSRSVIGRTVPTENALAAAAFFSLWVNPSLLDNRGFLLSYCAVAAILFYGLPLEELLLSLRRPFALIPPHSLSWWQRAYLKIRTKFVGVACISFSAFLSGSPFAIAYFGIFTLLSVIANFVVIPFASATVVCAIISAVLWHIPLAGILSDILWRVACWFVWIPEVFTGMLSQTPLHFRMEGVPTWFGAIGGILLLTSFFVGASLKFFRDRPLLRFALPPALFCAYIVPFVVK